MSDPPAPRIGKRQMSLKTRFVELFPVSSPLLALTQMFYPIQNLTAAREQLELFHTHGARAIVVTRDQESSPVDLPLRCADGGFTSDRST